jgi:tRNA (mo5U34)-methyltransferase
MGLLYHQRNPKEHLKILKEFLKPNGQIIIETIVAPEEYDFALEPSDRYASMPNVHFVHSDKGCKAIFDELGLSLVMETESILTNHLEQRKTRWMPFKSFEAALKPDDPSLTIEGYPAPSRKFYLLEISS